MEVMVHGVSGGSGGSLPAYQFVPYDTTVAVPDTYTETGGQFTLELLTSGDLVFTDAKYTNLYVRSSISAPSATVLNRILTGGARLYVTIGPTCMLQSAGETLISGTGDRIVITSSADIPMYTG